MDTKPATVYQFAGFRLDTEQKQLFGRGERLSLDRKTLEILEVLVKNSGKLVTKQRLQEEIWGNIFVSEENITTHVSKIRKALGDERKRSEYIETVRGEGYRFLAPVQVLGKNSATTVQSATAPRGPARAILTSVVGMLLIAAAAGWVWRSRVGRPMPTDSPTASSAARSQFQLALQYEAQGKDDEALDALDEAVKTDTDFADAYVKAALISDQLGEEERALRYLERAQKCSGFRNEHTRLTVEALEARIIKTNREALRKYHILADSFPTDTSALYSLSDVALESRTGYAEAADAIDRCLRVDPKNRDCNFSRLMLYVLSGEFERAIDFHDSLKETVQYPWFEGAYGLALYGNGDLEKARDVLMVFARAPGSHGLSRFTAGKEWLADIDLFKGKIKEADGSLQLLLTSDSQSSRADHYLYLAKLYSLMGNRSAARNMALKAGSVSQVKAMRIGVSAVLACAGFLKDSAAVLSQSPGAPSPDLSPETKTLIGGCNAMNQGKAESGARELAASLDLDNDIYVEFFLGRAYMESRRPQQAIEIFKDLIASKGTIIASQSYPPVIWPLAHYQLAVTYDNASDTENAIRYYSKFLEIWSGADAMPEIVYAKNRLTTLRKGIHSGHNDPQRSR